jgi:carbamoyltransferase
MDNWILGVNASHNGAAILLKNGKIHVGVQEERLVGVKKARIFSDIESASINYCLKHAGITVNDLNLISICVQGDYLSQENDFRNNPSFRELIRHEKIVYYPHHMCHAAGAHSQSGFESEVIVVIDGVGSPETNFTPDELEVIVNPGNASWETISIYSAKQKSLKPIFKQVVHNGDWYKELSDHSFPSFNSLGGMYSAVTKQIFGDDTVSGKTMALASYGKPVFPVNKFLEIIDNEIIFTNHIQTEVTPTDALWPQNERLYQNLAASVQTSLEKALTHIFSMSKKMTGEKNVSFCGGVALNCVANEKIIRQAIFEHHYFMPSSEDCGTAIGAAFLAYWGTDHLYSVNKQSTDSIGCHYSSERPKIFNHLDCMEFSNEADMIDYGVEKLASSEIIGWFHGGSEFGPRALGHRSILADPRNPTIQDQINSNFKFREPFRPFAPVILEQHAKDWYDLKSEISSPFMMRAVPFHFDKRGFVQSAVHVDGTGRYQTVTKEDNFYFYYLIEAFAEETSVPIVLNTSFNIKNEPIVETPADAIISMLASGIRTCIFDFFAITIPSNISFDDLTVKCNKFHDVQKINDSVSLTIITQLSKFRHVISQDIFDILGKIDSLRLSEVELLIENNLGKKLNGANFSKQLIVCLRRMHLIELTLD